MRLLLVLALFAGAISSSPLQGRSDTSLSPKVIIANGTLAGIYSSEYQQDFFLGIPYAQPPVGDLRFNNPQPLNSTWAGEKEVKALSPSCVGYGPSQWGYNLSEDCLYLNIVRPSGRQAKPLPVLVWIHGGGFVQGAGSDLRYNMSFMVERSVELGQPIIGVSLNYRLSAWGFLSSREVADSGSSNFGYRDQRLSLEWIHENIAAFGGDPDKVTVWGQSAGAVSVGRQMYAYDGRDDGLFRGAILDSGTAVFNEDANMTSSQSAYDSLISQAGCGEAADTLACLREVPYEQLNRIINTTALTNWSPKIDGDFFTRRTGDQFHDNAFVKIPVIFGATSDEGTGIARRGINTTAQFEASLPRSWSEDFRARILDAYPERSPENNLQNLGVDYTPPAYPWGTQWIRTATFTGDRTFIAPRRAHCEKWASLGLKAYCFRFNAIPAWASPLEGSTHFAEVAFAMLNLEGVGYAPVRVPPFEGLGEEFRDLARLMASDYIAFTVSNDPNNWEGRSAVAKTLGDEVPEWPVYRNAGKCGKPAQNFLYDANITSSVENDTFRSAGIRLLNSLI